MGRYLSMVNQQMVMLGQLQTLAQLKASAQQVRQHLVILKAQAGLFRMRTGHHPYPTLETTTQELLDQLKEQGLSMVDLYKICLKFSSQGMQHLEDRLLELPEEHSELPGLIRSARDDLQELKDWVVLLAGGTPAY